MSKVTLDIICETAFGYKADTLHNPHNELAVAYEKLLGLQSGTSQWGIRRFLSHYKSRSQSRQVDLHNDVTWWP